MKAQADEGNKINSIKLCTWGGKNAKKQINTSHVKIEVGLHRSPESYWGNLMGLRVRVGGLQSWSSSYSAVVAERKPQVDVMFPASLLSCQLLLHNWRQINVILSSVDGGRRELERQGERWRSNHRFSPSRGLREGETKQNNNCGLEDSPSLFCLH